MNSNETEKLIKSYMKPLYGFALRKTANHHDAEDLAQDIVCKLLRALSVRDDIVDRNAYVWTIAYNALANFYRDRGRHGEGIPMDENSDWEADNRFSVEEQFERKDSSERLHREIAFLAEKQRRIVIDYYFEGRKQSEIVGAMGIPEGTVKWHLFEAKQRLKEGMENMKDLSQLKFNPVEFIYMGTSGSIGGKGGTGDFLKGKLTQNIVYSAYHEERTVNEIADLIGVSPVYIESEVKYLEEHGFLESRSSGRYRSLVLIDEWSRDLIQFQDTIYQKAAELLAPKLYDRMIDSGLLETDDIYTPGEDRNFLMWSLLFFILAESSNSRSEPVSFDEVAPMRKDGGQYIAYTVLEEEKGALSESLEEFMGNWSGPLWNGQDGLLLWQIVSPWSASINIQNDYSEKARYNMKLMKRLLAGDLLSPLEYAHLAEKGIITGSGDYQLNLLWVKNDKRKESLIALGNDLRREVKRNVDSLISEYSAEVMKKTPSHMKKTRQYLLQYLFRSDGYFLFHCAKSLVAKGLLKDPVESQRQTLSTILFTE